MTTTINIDSIFDLLSNSDHSLRDRRIVIDGPGLPGVGEVINTDTISKEDVLQAFLFSRGGYSYSDIYNTAFNVIDSTTMSQEKKQSYIKSFVEYISLVNQNSTPNNDVDIYGSATGFLARAARDIGKETKEFFDGLADHKGDVSQIGFYNILETDNPDGLPCIIPSSISIQEQLLNQPVPTLRSKSVGVIPDHRSKHIVSLDILFPNFECFSTTNQEYPSFINLLNMFRFMPINTIYSPILSSCFISEHTFPSLFNLVKNVFAKNQVEELSDPSKSVEQKMSYISNQLLGDDYSLSDIKELFSYSDVNLDIGFSAIADSILSAKERESGTRTTIEASQEIHDFIASRSAIPLPVAFKSASVQSHADMPGAIIGRFSFGIIASSAFPYGSVMYRDRKGKPTYNPSDCYYGKKYVSIASKKLLSQAKIDKNNILKASKNADNFWVRYKVDVSSNDLRLYYFDYEDGPIIFDTSNPRYVDGSVVLEKVSGVFNTKSVEIPLMGAKFPSVQYMGMNSNACQLIFNITDKQVIADFMAMKAAIVKSEKNQSLHASFAIVENTFINSLGISRITPQSISVDSDPDVPELYRLTINFMENYQDIGKKEKLRLEKGAESTKNLDDLWNYFYDLYLVWYAINFKKDPSKGGPLYNLAVDTSRTQITHEYSEGQYLQYVQKLNLLMEALGVKAEYDRRDNNISTVLNPGRMPHDVYYGPVFMGIVETYAKRKTESSTTGYLEYDFPEVLDPRLPKIFDSIGTLEGTRYRDHIEDVIDLVAQGYNFVRGRTREEKKSIWDSALVKITVNGNLALGKVLNFAIPDETIALGGEFVRNFGYRNKNYKNLVDMFHKNNVPIPREIWKNTFKSVLERKYTKGNNILVSFDQIDNSFALLYELFSKFKDSYLFNTYTNSDGDTYTDFKIETTYYRSDGSKIISNDYNAKLNISQIKKEEETIKQANNKPINLYPDLYLPTYEELIGDEPEADPNRPKSYTDPLTARVATRNDHEPARTTRNNAGKKWAKDAWANSALDFRKNFLEVFAPKYGDSGTIPIFNTDKDIYMGAKEISFKPSVTIDHYIDPDIFYYRQRDKNNMIISMENAIADKENMQKTIKTGATITVDADFDVIHKKAMQEAVDAGRLDENVPITYDNPIAREFTTQLLQKCVSDFVEKTNLNTDLLPQGLNSFSAIGINEMDQKTAEDLTQYLKSIKSDYSPEEDTIYGSRKIIHLEFASNDRKLIGVVAQNKDTKYHVIPNANVGGTPAYFTNTNNMSFALTEDFENATSERTLLHTPDLTDSVLKSFPTIRLYIIEEDRQQSFYADDFYGFDDVIECNISSHIYDNDVCRMKLANFSGVLTTMEFDNFDYNVKIKEALEDSSSIEANRTKNLRVVDEARERFLRKIMLRPGVHIMIKMGYGNNIDTLKTVFTGEIAEIKPGPIVELVAQGYQTELHNEFGGFMEEGFWESGLAFFESNQDESLKFGFSKIINYILLMNDGHNKRLAKNNMAHLGTPFSNRPKYKGIFGARNSSYDYYSKRSHIRYLLSDYETVQDFIADSQGETFSWLDSWFESSFFGFVGTDVSRNIYVATSNNSSINVANEWLITNAPVIDSLREAVRYMPNYIATVVPYEQDATLFIGDPANIYQYRKPTKVEADHEIKYNNLLNIRRDQNNFFSKTYEIDRLIDSANRINDDYIRRIQTFNYRYDKSNKTPVPEKLLDDIKSVVLNPVDLSRINSNIAQRIFCRHLGIKYDPTRDYSVPMNRILYKTNVLYVNSGIPEDPVNGVIDLYELPLRDQKFNPIDIYQYGTMIESSFRFTPQGKRISMDHEVIGKTELVKKILNEYLPEAEYFSDTDPDLEARVKFNNISFTGTNKRINLIGSAVLRLKTIFFLINKIIDDQENNAFYEARKIAEDGVKATEEINILPWNYKVFRDHHVLSSEHDLIANNLAASESDMWSAVALRVPKDTIDIVNGAWEWQAAQYGIKEGGVDRSAGTYRIDSDQSFGIYPNNLAGGVNYLGRQPGPKDVLENFTEVNATTDSLAQNVLKFRLAQGLSKMYRGNLICMGRNIKPYDQIHLIDNVNHMYGKVMVERVIQNFSATTGWTTTIVPCGMSRVNSKQASHNISETDRWLYTLSQGKTANILMNALTVLSFGTAGLGVRGTALFAKEVFGSTFRRLFRYATFQYGNIFTRGATTAVWKIAKAPFSIGKRIYRNAGTGFNYLGRVAPTLLGQRVATHFTFGAWAYGAGAATQGTTDILHQFNNLQISQSVVLFNQDNTTVHQPCHISVLSYNGIPFIAGLEDPLQAFSNDESWAQLFQDFEYGLREWLASPQGKFDSTQILNQKFPSIGDPDG